MGNTSSADLAAWGANAVAALAWWYPSRGDQLGHSTSAETTQHDSQEKVATEYRAQQEASRVALIRLLQEREEDMVGCIEDLERELLISCQMAERDERLRGRLLGLQGVHHVRQKDRRTGHKTDDRADQVVERHIESHDDRVTLPEEAISGLRRCRKDLRSDRHTTPNGVGLSRIADRHQRLSEAPDLNDNRCIQPESGR